MKPAKRFLGKTGYNVLLIVEVAAFLAFMRALLFWVNVAAILRWLKPSKIPAEPDAPTLNQVKRFADAVLRRVPAWFGGQCLPRSLTLYYFATRCGYPVQLHCGVRRDGTALQGHAWLTLDGKLFLEDDMRDRTYSVSFTFPPLEA